MKDRGRQEIPCKWIESEENYVVNIKYGTIKIPPRQGTDEANNSWSEKVFRDTFPYIAQKFHDLNERPGN